MVHGEGQIREYEIYTFTMQEKKPVEFELCVSCGNSNQPCDGPEMDMEEGWDICMPVLFMLMYGKRPTQY